MRLQAHILDVPSDGPSKSSAKRGLDDDRAPLSPGRCDRSHELRKNFLKPGLLPWQGRTSAGKLLRKLQITNIRSRRCFPQERLFVGGYPSFDLAMDGKAGQHGPLIHRPTVNGGIADG